MKIIKECDFYNIWSKLSWNVLLINNSAGLIIVQIYKIYFHSTECSQQNTHNPSVFCDDQRTSRCTQSPARVAANWPDREDRRPSPRVSREHRHRVLCVLIVCLFVRALSRALSCLSMLHLLKLNGSNMNNLLRFVHKTTTTTARVALDLVHLSPQTVNWKVWEYKHWFVCWFWWLLSCWSDNCSDSTQNDQYFGVSTSCCKTDLLRFFLLEVSPVMSWNNLI